MMKELPQNYRITNKDMERGWELAARYFVDGEDLTQDKEYLMDLLTDGQYLYTRTGKRPTVADVHEYWRQLRCEREQKRINSWSESYTLREKDFTEEAEPDGPMAQFISVAKKLKIELGRMPSVKEVRDAKKKS